MNDGTLKPVVDLHQEYLRSKADMEKFEKIIYGRPLSTSAAQARSLHLAQLAQPRTRSPTKARKKLGNGGKHSARVQASMVSSPSIPQTMHMGIGPLDLIRRT